MRLDCRDVVRLVVVVAVPLVLDAAAPRGGTGLALRLRVELGRLPAMVTIIECRYFVLEVYGCCIRVASL